MYVYIYIYISYIYIYIHLVCVHIYIYIYIHTHTTHVSFTSPTGKFLLRFCRARFFYVCKTQLSDKHVPFFLLFISCCCYVFFVCRQHILLRFPLRFPTFPSTSPSHFRRATIKKLSQGLQTITSVVILCCDYGYY